VFWGILPPKWGAVWTRPQKAHPWAETRRMTYRSSKSVHVCRLGASRRIKLNKKLPKKPQHVFFHVFAQTTHVVAAPHGFACAGISATRLYIPSFIEIRSGVSEPQGVKIWHFPLLWYSLLQQLVLPYKPWSYRIVCHSCLIFWAKLKIYSIATIQLDQKATLSNYISRHFRWNIEKVLSLRLTMRLIALRGLSGLFKSAISGQDNPSAPQIASPVLLWRCTNCWTNSSGKARFDAELAARRALRRTLTDLATADDIAVVWPGPTLPYPVASFSFALPSHFLPSTLFLKIPPYFPPFSLFPPFAIFSHAPVASRARNPCKNAASLVECWRLSRGSWRLTMTEDRDKWRKVRP